ncbi:MAG TPA: DNA primase [Gammaproteobacteria bacterium]|nr:DNA primase [Gammaproteobacteria bacterium]
MDSLRQRVLSVEIAACFGIGYASPGWDGLAGELGDDAAATRAALELGLLVERDSGGHYDRFRDRVMFPIRDRRGRVVGFGGRVLGDEKPKYMNSPESPVFHKGRELYGLFEARKAQRKLERLLVVEGYMDVVALAQFGIDNAVATLGTATTSDHLERLFRVVPEVVFCFDGDAAGRKAAWRALENALPVMQQGRQARFLFLPEGEDPDTLVRKEGKELFLQRTVDSVPLSRFFFESLARQVDTGSMDGRARLAELARPLLQSMPDSLFRDMMVERLAELTRLDAGTLRTRLFGQAREAPAAGRRPGRQESSGRSPVRQAITLLLHHPQLARLPDLPDGWQGLDAPGVPLLVELLEFLRSRPHLKTGAILEHWRDRAEERHLARLAAVPPTVPETGLEQEFPGLLARLQEQQIARRTEELLAMSHGRALDDAEKAELKQLLAHGQPNRGETR